MKISKRFAVLSFSLSLALVGLLQLASPQKALAEPAKCYASVIPETTGVDGEHPGQARLTDCASTQFQSMLNTPFYNGTTLTAYRDDHCYTLGEFVVIDTAANAAPVDGVPSCTQLASWAQSANDTPPKCYYFNEDTLANFYGWAFEPSLLTETQCTQALNGAYKLGLDSANKTKGGTGVDIPNGSCVVFSKNLEFTSPPCSTLGAAIRSAEQAAISRNESGTAGKSCDTKGNCTVNTDQVVVNCTSQKYSCDFTKNFINPIVRFLAGGVGFVVIIVIIIGGIRYTTSGGDSQKAAAARKMIYNAVLALVAYIFLYAILSWLLPKGWLPVQP